MYRISLFLLLSVFTSLAVPGTLPMDKASSPHAQASGGSLLLNEISPWPSDGTVWVEFINFTEQPVELGGWAINFISGYSYTFPSGSPTIPAGGLHLLRITGGNAVNLDGDGCILTGPNGAVDVITWGMQTGENPSELTPGAPLFPPYGVLSSEKLFTDNDVLIRIPDTWPPSRDRCYGSDLWAYRSGDQATPGAPNNYPGPTHFSPGDEEEIASNPHLAILGAGWTGETTFQVATDESFANIVFEQTVEGNSVAIDNLPAGTYFWRVRGSNNEPESWSTSHEFSLLGIDIDALIAAAGQQTGEWDGISRPRLASAKAGETPPDLPLRPEEEVLESHVVGVQHQLQHKDTDMVCMDGCPMEGAMSWEDPHNSVGTHGRQYCSRACLSMIASSFGCHLSQDRITYYIFEEAGRDNLSGQEAGHQGDPFMDLGHNIGTFSSSTIYTLEWIYNQPHGTGRRLENSMFNWNDGDPSDMDSVVEYINAGRPLIRHSSTHSTVVDGYAVIRIGDGPDNERYYIHVLDPAGHDDVVWVNFQGGDTLEYNCPPPTGTPMRCDEPGVSRDSDGDMLVDFDETERLGTDPHSQDSDGDNVNDMIDMYGYLFDPDGTYNLRERDYDGDGQPKELDPDNDDPEDDSVNDGCEDINLDGFYNDDGTETDCFLSADDFGILNRFCFTGTITIESESEIAGMPGSHMSTRETLYIENGQPYSSSDYIYNFKWELWNDGFEVPIPGGTIRADAYGSLEGLASIRISVDGNNYRMVTDTQPRVGAYTIHTTGPGIDRTTTCDFYLHMANHHFGYVSEEAPEFVDEALEEIGAPNIFRGQVTHDPGGGTRISGSDMVEASGYFPGIDGYSQRTWEIWIDRS
jgi:hypothetical protein